MLGRSKLILAAGAMLMAGASQAGATLIVGGGSESEPVPAYRTTMYSDAT